MKDSVWRIFDKFFIILMIFILLSFIAYSIITTKNNILYYNNYKIGKITSINSRTSGSSDGPNYYQLICKIDVNGKTYTSGGIESGTNINIGDVVYCKKISSNLLRVLSVNSKKINKEYGIVDIISLIICIILPFIIFRFVKKKMVIIKD